jgi:hypothetical protein
MSDLCINDRAGTQFFGVFWSPACAGMTTVAELVCMSGICFRHVPSRELDPPSRHPRFLQTCRKPRLHWATGASNSKVIVDVAGSESVQEFECCHDGRFDGQAIVVDFASVGAHEDVDTFAAVELVGRATAIERVVAFFSVK